MKTGKRVPRPRVPIMDPAEDNERGLPPRELEDPGPYLVLAAAVIERARSEAQWRSPAGRTAREFLRLLEQGRGPAWIHLAVELAAGPRFPGHRLN